MRYKFLDNTIEDPIFRFLKGAFPGDIGWNFNKFLVSRDGKVL